MRVQMILRWTSLRSAWALAVLSVAAIATTAGYMTAQVPEPDPDYRAFLKTNCFGCHNADNSTAGVRVDNLDEKFGDDTVKRWEAVHHRIGAGTMPPKGAHQPSPQERTSMADWIAKNLEVAKRRPAPKNGNIRRLTVAQYRNTLRELLGIDQDFASILPADAISKDGFLNNASSLQLSPLLMEAYFEIADKALNHAIVDPNRKPEIQNFRVDLGAGVNPDPLAEKLVLGAGSALLETSDVLVTQLTPKKPFAFEPFFMRTKYRFIEGYRGNDTVRGWRDFDSIYHSVFADMRGSGGYPKGEPWSTVPEGLLLRPAIPTEEMFDEDGTYGPKANFKISLRELPDTGRFRVTVTAAKYDDGLLLDQGVKARTSASGVVLKAVDKTVTIPKEGIYQVDIYPVESKPVSPDASRLKEGLSGAWPTEALDSPAVQPITAPLTVPRNALPTDDQRHVGEGDFTVSAWIKPKQPGRHSIVTLGAPDRTRGWFLEIPNNRASLRFQTAGEAEGATAAVSTRSGVVRPNQWSHVAVVVRRGQNETLVYINGSLAAKADIGSAQFDAERADLKIAESFDGEVAAVRLYRRPLGEAEIAALLEPGKSLLQLRSEGGKQGYTEDGTTVRRRRAPDLALHLGDREFTGTLDQPAFLVLRLKPGPLKVSAKYDNVKELDRIILTPLTADDPLARRFRIFEKRQPRVGVHLGLRRDCGSTLAPVGLPQTVAGTKLSKYVFEGTIDNFPAPVVEKDNVNYLAGIHEIGIRSEYTDGRDMPRLILRSVEFEGPWLESWPPPSHKNIFITRTQGADDETYAKQVITNFATKAFRRPINRAEEQSLQAVYAKSRQSGRSFQEAIRDTLQVVLTSPQFLFLIETSASPQPEPLDNWELASKLSYFLWNGPPDAHTRHLAASGLLAKELDREIDRMMADSRFARFTSEFVAQWLNLDKFQVLEADRKRFPKLTRDTRRALEQEPVEFVQYLIRNNLSASNLISSEFILANEPVANYYDLADKTENGFRFDPIRHGRSDLGGVLSQAAILAGLSDGRESNPVKRGAWVARKIVAEPPADPPPNVPALKDTAGLTLRQRLEQHRNVPACMQCHLKIDPWGVPFEDYDAGGRRKKEQVDSKSTLPDKTEVVGVDGLKRYLAEDRMDQVAFSVLKHLTTYAAGRSLTYNELYDLRTNAVRDLKVNGYRMKDMVRYVAKSPSFLQK
jgi:mono/diheme cytochrome c family protein